MNGSASVSVAATWPIQDSEMCGTIMAEAIARLKRSGCTMGAVKIVANGFGFTASAPLPAMDPSTLYRASRHATSIVVVEAA